jgi:hypothetical protein
MKRNQQSHPRIANLLKKQVEKSYTELCVNLLVLDVKFRKIKPLVRFARMLALDLNDAATLVMIITNKGRVERKVLGQLLPWFTEAQVAESVSRLRSHLFVRGTSPNLRGDEVVQLNNEFKQAFNRGDVIKILELSPEGGSHSIMAYVARCTRNGPYETEEWDHFMDHLWTSQSEDHEFLRYIDDLEFMDTIQLSFMLLIASNHYFFNDSTNLRDLKELVRYSESDVRELSIDIVRNQWKPIAQGYVEIAEGNTLFSSPGLKLTQLGIDTFFPDLDFNDTIQGIGAASPFKPFSGDLKNLRFSDRIQEKVDSIEQLLGLGVYEDFVKVAPSHKGILVLLYGKPGTGKTAWCENILAKTRRPMLAINSATVISKWVGESASQIRKIFDRYRSHVKHYGTYPVILLNEADQILGKRTEISSSSDTEYNAINSNLLECLEGILTDGGIVLATTNTKDHLDEAFGRRFTDIVEFTGLDAKEQIGLWQALLPEVLNEYQAEYLLDLLGPLEPGYIQNIVSKYHRHLFLNRGSSAPLDLLVELGLNARGLNAA